MPAKCITFKDVTASDLPPPPATTFIESVQIIDLLNPQGQSARLRIRDVDGDGLNEFEIGAGTALFAPMAITGIYQVVVHAAHYVRGVGVYTIEAFDSKGNIVASAGNVIAQPKITETLLLTASSDEAICSIKITGQEVVVEKICFISEQM